MTAGANAEGFCPRTAAVKLKAIGKPKLVTRDVRTLHDVIEKSPLIVPMKFSAGHEGTPMGTQHLNSRTRPNHDVEFRCWETLNALANGLPVN